MNTSVIMSFNKNTINVFRKATQWQTSCNPLTVIRSITQRTGALSLQRSNYMDIYNYNNDNVNISKYTINNNINHNIRQYCTMTKTSITNDGVLNHDNDHNKTTTSNNQNEQDLLKLYYNSGKDENKLIEYYQSNVEQVTANETKLMNWDILHWASLYNHKELMNLIILNRIKNISNNNNTDLQQIFKQDKYGVSPLHIAVQQNHIETVELLLQNGCDVNVRDKKPQIRLSSLHLALNKQIPNIEMVKVLIKYGANVNQETTERRTPLFTACSLNSIPLVKLLLENGANMNIQDNPRTNGWEYYRVNTPIHIAITKGNIDLVQLLFNHGGKVNLQLKDEVGESLLHVAVLKQDEKMVKFLLDQGADKFVKDTRGSTPLDYAKSSPSQEIINLLS